MAIAGTGLNSHLEFLRQTEYYRRELVRRLNEEDAFGVARAESGRLQRTTTKDFYLSFDSFEYKPLALGEMLGRRTTDLLALALWIFGASALLILTARQMEARRVS
jgi:ABC-2 type transport system permease protein